MHYELEAMERKGMLDKISNLEEMLDDMNSDFEKCARGTSPCFFCANDEHCVDPDKHGCHFIWSRHN